MDTGVQPPVTDERAQEKTWHLACLAFFLFFSENVNVDFGKCGN